MNENGQKLSKLCVVGLILPILSAVLFWCGITIGYVIELNNGAIFLYIFIFPSFVLPVLGLIFSIAGVNDAKRKEKRGAGAGVAGIVLSSLEISLVIFCLTFVNNYLKKVTTTPPDYTLPTHDSIVETIDPDVLNLLTDNTNSTAST